MRTRSRIHAIAIDPGFAHVGVVAIALGPGLDAIELVAVDVWTTEKSAKKRGVKSPDDDFRRVRELSAKMLRFFDIYTPGLIASESKSPMRNSSVWGKVCLMVGALALEVERRRLPYVQASPGEIRVALGLAKNAGKEEVEAAARRKLAERSRYADLFCEIPEAMRVHAWDAVASYFACENTDIVRAVRSRS